MTRRRRSRRVIFFTPGPPGRLRRDIFLYHWKEADGELIRWDRVGGAVIGRSYAVVLRNADGRVQRELPLEFFGSRKRANQFALAVHDRLRRRGPLSSWVTTDPPSLGPE